MTTIEIPRQKSVLLKKIEERESVNVVKSGEAIALIIPLPAKKNGWNKSHKKIRLPRRISAQKLIEEERSLK